MEVFVLGPLLVKDAERTVEVGGARLRALLIRLAADPGRWVPIGTLVDALWAEEPPSDEVNALQSLVSRLRRALGRPGVIESGPAGYRLAVAPEEVDATRFEQLVSAGRLLLSEGRVEPASMRLRDALDQWRGQPLPDVLDAPYAAAWAHRLGELRFSATEDLAAAELQLGHARAAVDLLEPLTSEDALRERAWPLLVRALAGAGRTADALAAYERHRSALADELGLDPSPELQQLHVALLRGELTQQQPEKPRRTNLRASLTSFVGRERDLLQLHGLLQRSRLVTLVGAGGAGKTRLARETAGTLDGADVGTDGVWMVELAPVSDPEDISSVAAGSLGAREMALRNGSPVRTGDAQTLLLDALAGRDVLMILDNCEHLVDAAAAFAETILGQSPRLRILATSREPLGIVGESLWPVKPLTGPEEGAGTPEAALETSAVRLFADRAALVQPGFEVTEGNVGVVTEICRRLDGLPLAIELAAARLRSMPVEAVADRLGDRFRLLTSGNRTAMPRHQTLRAVVAWSWDLLTESERRLAERMSVFPGGADPESAEAVCARPTPGLENVVPPEAVSDLLAALADKSLLVPVEGSGRPRYRMLETIREFASEQLAERGEVEALRDAHARYFLELAETAEPILRGPEQVFWLRRLNTERDNLLAALRHAADTSDAATGLRLGAALAWYWTLLGRHDEAANWLKQALAIEGEKPRSAYALCWTLYVVSAAGTGLEMPAESVGDEMLALARELDIMNEHPLLALVEPGVYVLRDDGEATQAAIKRNLQHRDPWARAMLLLMSGVAAENDGDREEMERAMPQALAQFRLLGDRWGIGTALGATANLQVQLGELDAAIAALQEARRMMFELRAHDDEAFLALRIGLLRLRQGDLAGARADIDAARVVADESGAIASGSQGRLGQALIAHYEHRDTEARQLIEDALALAEQAPVGPPQLKAGIYSTTAAFDIAEGKLDDAAARLAQALKGARSSRDMPVTAQVAITAADLAAARGELETAVRLLGTAENLRGMPDPTDLEERRISERLRADLGDEEFTRLRAGARASDRPVAVALLEETVTAWAEEGPGPDRLRSIGPGSLDWPKSS